MKNKKRKNEPMEASIALRVLADAVGLKWKRMLMDECDGLGHIHDMWNEMYQDMDAIVCFEKYITAHEGVCGCDFGTPRGFEKYDDDLPTEEGELEEVKPVKAMSGGKDINVSATKGGEQDEKY